MRAISTILATILLLPVSVHAQNDSNHAPYKFPEPPETPVSGDSGYTGFYTGEIVTNTGLHVPLQFSIFVLKNVLVNSHPGLSIYAESENVGGLLLSGEGLYPLCYITYDAFGGAGVLLLEYCRDDPNQPNVWLEGKLTRDFVVKGTVASGKRGKVGEFRAQKNFKQSKFSMRPLTEGTWKGTWTFPDGTAEPFSLSLADSGKSTQNPMDVEFAYSPGRIGSARIGNFEIPFSRVVLDYFSGQTTLVFQDSSSGTTLDLLVNITEAGVSGTGGSSLRGIAGTFTATKVSPAP